MCKHGLHVTGSIHALGRKINYPQKINQHWNHAEKGESKVIHVVLWIHVTLHVNCIHKTTLAFLLYDPPNLIKINREWQVSVYKITKPRIVKFTKGASWI